jgi:hypothetical protein
VRRVVLVLGMIVVGVVVGFVVRAVWPRSR